MRRTLLTLVLLALTAVLMAVAVPAASAATCIGGWGSLPRDAMGSSAAPVLDVRAGPNPCYDRVVIDLGGPMPGGYHAAYVAQVTGIASGLVVPTPGGARIQLTVRDPATGTPPRPSVAGFATLRSITYAGSFEGVTSFGIGLRARLPFRVFTLPGPGTHSRLVLDVAHHW